MKSNLLKARSWIMSFLVPSSSIRSEDRSITTSNPSLRVLRQIFNRLSGKILIEVYDLHRVRKEYVHLSLFQRAQAFDEIMSNLHSPLRYLWQLHFRGPVPASLIWRHAPRQIDRSSSTRCWSPRKIRHSIFSLPQEDRSSSSQRNLLTPF